MHNHDPDLILSLANGDLSGASAETATAEIAACAECSLDLEMQRIAVDALQRLPEPALSASERSSLHADLRQQLGLVEQEAPVAETQRRRLINWSAIAVAAVVLTGVVLVGPLLGLLGGTDSADQVASDLAATSEEAGGEDEAANFSRSQTTPAAGATTSTVAALAPSADSLSEAPASALEDAGGLVYQFEQLDLDRLRLSLTSRDTDAPAAEWNQDPRCIDVGIEELGAEFGTVFAVGTYLDRAALAAAYTVVDEPEVVIAIQDAETCEILATDPP